MLLQFIVSISLFTSTIEKAFDHYENHDYTAAAALLDESALAHPEQFDLNNLHYLRGRIAEKQRDWQRAEREYSKTSESSVLFRLSLWRRIRSHINSGNIASAKALLDRLPSSFPAHLRLKLAENAPTGFALMIYDSINTRQSIWNRARIRNNEAEMWSLLAKQQTDDIALLSARKLIESPAGSERSLRLAKTFYAHRQFEQAATLYSKLLEDITYGAEAHFELGRTYFQKGNYSAAIELYNRTMKLFPGTNWERDAEYQIASCYWRMEDYPKTAEAYLMFIKKYNDKKLYESSVRNLVDVYRVIGNTQTALHWINLALSKNPSRTNRQDFLFTKAKLFLEEDNYSQALVSLNQLSKMRLRSAPNGPDEGEVQYFKAVALESLGRETEARSILENLAKEPFNYYALRAAQRLEPNSPRAEIFNPYSARVTSFSSKTICNESDDKKVREALRARRLGRTRGFHSDNIIEMGLVGELVFLRLWDEAFYWANRSASRWKNVALADLAYLASNFQRSMLYADRLRPEDNKAFFSLAGKYAEDQRTLLGMLFPLPFNNLLCKESVKNNVNPLWLQAIIWQESRYDPLARSPASARGLMQFIPETASAMAVDLSMEPLSLNDLYEPSVSIQLGAHYWSQLMAKLGHPALALAAYNGGISNVRRWLAKSKSNDIDLFVSNIGFSQTKDYVKQVFSLYATYAHLR